MCNWILEHIKELLPLCTRRIRGIGQIHINSPLFDSPRIEFTKEDRLTIYLPPEVKANVGLLEFINSIVIPKNDKMVSSIYVKMIHLDGKEINIERSVDKVTEEVMEEFAMKGITKPFAFYRIQVKSKVIQ